MEKTIDNIVDIIVKAVPGVNVKDTVDTFKAGDPSQLVTGIVTTFLASYEVIQRTAEFGANLIITHEPTFYNHLDAVDWLEDDLVYQAKRQLIAEHNIVIWRFHDLWDRYGIIPGLARELGWEDFADPESNVYIIPPTSVRDLTISLKEKLGITVAKVVGDLEMVCRRAALSPGFAGAKRQIPMLGPENVDVLICGEIHEWEACEYVRDAVAEGRQKALIVLGHIFTEEPGMKWLAEWLTPLLPGVTITHVPTGDPFHIL